jgi:hypothetical protein
MKKNGFLIFCWILLLPARAQMPPHGSIEISSGPVFNSHFPKAERMPSWVDGSLPAYSDSLRKSDGMRMGLNYGIHYLKTLNRNKAIRIGVQLSDYGFRRIRNNLGFGDSIHPEVGLVADFSQIGPRDVYYDVRYRMLEVPFSWVWNTNFQDLKKELQIHITAGFAPSYLWRHETIVRLRGFTTRDGIFDYRIDNTGYQARSFNLALTGGMRLDYAMDRRIHLLAAPNLRLPLLAAATRPYERHRPWQFGIETGIIVRLGAIPSQGTQRNSN